MWLQRLILGTRTLQVLEMYISQLTPSKSWLELKTVEHRPLHDLVMVYEVPEELD